MPVINRFGGIYPRLPEHLKPEGSAVRAHNVRLRDGRLEPWLAPLPLGLAPAGTLSFHLWSCCPYYWPECAEAVEYLPDYGRMFITGRRERPETMSAVGCAPTYQYLGLPAPSTPPLAEGTEIFGETGDARTYVYTYINQYGEESAPSPPSRQMTVEDGSSVRVFGLAPPPDNYGIVGIIIYRTATGYRSGGEAEQKPATDWLTVWGPAPFQSEINDEVLTRHLGPALTTSDDRPPPAALRHLRHVNGTGLMVGHTGHQVHFSEDYQPWNWPARYDLSLPCNIVGLGTLDTTVFVTTDGQPFVIDGSVRDPGQPRPARDSDSRHPDLACGYLRQQCVTPFGLVYSTLDGLALLRPDATVDIITKAYYSSAQWAKMRPETARLAFWRGGLIAALAGETLLLNIDGDKRGDYQPGALTTLSIRPTALQVTENDELLYLENGALYQWDAGEARWAYAWESRRLDLGGKAAPTVLRARTSGTTARLFPADEPEVYAERFIADDRPVRLNRLGRRRFWRLGFYGSEPVESAELGFMITTLPKGA